MKRIRIPMYAKENARKGLELRKRQPKSKKFGLSVEEAKEKGVFSGVRRARQLIRNESLSKSQAKDVRNFLNRFHGMADQHGYTLKIRGAILLWGGNKDKRFLKYLDRKLGKN